MTAQTLDTLGDDWVRPRPSRAGYRGDAILACVLLALSLFSSVLYRAAGFYAEPASMAVTLACVTLPCLVLAARRRFPLAVLLVTAAAFIVTQALMVPEILISNLVLFIALYTAGAWPTNRRAALVVRFVVIAAMFGWLFWALLTSPMTFLDDGPGVLFISSYLAFGLISLVTNLLYFGGAYYFGDRAWVSARGAAELERRSAELARERERNAAQAVLGERIRIARELHDVVAHHVSLMGVQAGAARRLLATAPDRAPASLTAVEASAREAVAELNRMLGTLREVDEPGHGSGTSRRRSSWRPRTPAARLVRPPPAPDSGSWACGSGSQRSAVHSRPARAPAAASW